MEHKHCNDHKDNNLHHHHDGNHDCCCGHDGHHHHDNCCDHDHDECGCGCNHNHNHEKKYKFILLVRVILSLLLLVLAFFIDNITVETILLIASYLIIAYDILFQAIKNIFKGKIFDENFLMSVASLTALIVYIFNKEAGIDGFDGVLVILLYQVGEFLQHLAVDKSKDSISKMLDLNVEYVTKVNDENEEKVKVQDIKLNDVLLIKAGDIIPVDGIIIEGSSSLNTSSLTGESKPIEVYINDKVLSGSINNDGVIKIKATSTSKDSTTAKVKKVIEEASKNKAKGERFITKFAKIYTPIVIFISLFVMFVIPLILGFNEYFLTYLYKGLAIMVISCPCALVISIPLSYFMGIGKSAKNGILVKGSNYLEILSSIKAIAFDKTGTLTKGIFEISKQESSNIDLMNTLLYSCEKSFTHPIATSITKHFEGKVKEVKIDNLVNIPGYGTKGIYEGKEVLIGNYKLLKENKINYQNVKETGSVVYVSYDNSCIGYVVIEDSLKDGIIHEINRLKQSYDLYIISGDNKEIVTKVANELNIDNIYYETLPEEKVNIINNIKKQKRVAYVGDGINDAACLIASSCGIALKSLGSDIAIKASDIVLMNDDISLINKSISISKKTMKIVKQNIVLSILIKVLVMVLAMIINIPMFIAIIADVGVCLLAICNSLRIMYGKYKK